MKKLMLAILVAMGTTAATAGGYYPPVINEYYITEEYITNEYITNEYVTEEVTNVTNTTEEITNVTDVVKKVENDYTIVSRNQLYEGFANAAGLAAIDFSPRITDLQLGLGLGGYAGRESIAAGFAKTVADDVLLSFKAARSRSHTMWSGAVTWVWK